MTTTFTLPELGENIESGTVTAVLVKAGDTIEKDQAVLELETDKAVVEVPSPVGGTVSEVRAQEGATLNVGDVILIIEDGAAIAAVQAAEPEEVAAAEIKPETEPEPIVESPLPPQVEESKPEPVPLAPASTPEPTAPAQTAPSGSRRAASPSVRRLAREIGVDIEEVAASNPSGRVSLADVKGQARRGRAAPVAAQPITDGQARGMALPNFERQGKVEREKMSNVRMRTAERMAAAWSAIPHVTQHDKADITELEVFRKKYAKRAEAKGGKLTATAILVKIIGEALKRFPQFNSSIDTANQEIILKHYYNVGVAVDTDRGLLVPVIKNVDQKSIVDIAVELSSLSERARTAKSTIDELQGGCITITNLGGIGGVGFTPIVNAPEVAILGVSRAMIEPVYVDGEFVPRNLLPLSLSYDHRVIDGAIAARFTRFLCEALEHPLLVMLEG